MNRNAWTSVAKTHVGNVRKINEDSYLNAPEAGLWCVADGMGGHQKGDTASTMIIDYLQSLLSVQGYPISTGQVEERLTLVNHNLINLAQSLPQSNVIGSTVAVMLFADNLVHCLWAGDSRIYRLRNGQLSQLTRDHSQVEEMVQAGLLTSEEAAVHPAANIITRAIGASPELELDLQSFERFPGDRYLLCTDGLNKVMTDPEIAEQMRQGELASLADHMMQTALQRHARDNITLVMVDVTEGMPELEQTGRLKDTLPLDDTLPLHR
ncbi:PP2C family protein-serine/threonine phosphatase [Bowmanella yangjiangensis]|uniref:Serine/threonine-protein phosphatase n=1 Tax=Bowmanella yangjiangensis TaxID=2811230 RepID=A0ABS3CZ05_9ALTE|nr:protein phosphatase 2C domain-containing protein [Bowmanella yangjiangensis]MBN7821636.1 serine/threonine-protein phosphatase [Bowmanella yangjiangensis]